MTKTRHYSDNLTAIIAGLSHEDTNGRVSIDTSSLTRSQSTVAIQQELSQHGLYVSAGHPYYNDGVPGDITSFGLRMAADPKMATEYIQNVASSAQFMTATETLKLQIALNAASDDPNAKIAVDGAFGPQTAGRLTEFLKQEKALSNEQKVGVTNSDIRQKLTTYEPAEKLEAIGIKPNSHEKQTFEQSAQSDQLTMVRPIDGRFPDSSEFKQRWGRAHQGVDIAAPVGTPIMAPADGEVAYAGHSSGYGQIVVLYHGHDTYSLHAHVPKSSTDRLEVGDKFRQGEPFAVVGDTGRIKGIHLHTEFILTDTHGSKGYVVDPQDVWSHKKDLADPQVRQELISDADRILGQYSHQSKVFGYRVAGKYNPDEFDQYLAQRDTDTKPAIELAQNEYGQQQSNDVLEMHRPI